MSDHLLIDEPFVAVNPALIRACGSASRAIVLQALWFARDRTTGATTMTMAQVSDRTGLSPRTVERATVWARGAGVLERGKVSAYDHTSVWRVAPNALATLTATNPPNGETEPDKVAESDPATMASSDSATLAGSSYENPEEPPTGENTPPLSLAAAQETASEFILFWAHYPRHTDRAKAETAFKRARKVAPLGVILAGVERLVAERRDPQFIPHPTTWLNGRRWEDEPPARRATDDRDAGGPGWSDGSNAAGWMGYAPTGPQGVAR